MLLGGVKGMNIVFLILENLYKSISGLYVNYIKSYVEIFKSRSLATIFDGGVCCLYVARGVIRV